MQEQQQTTYKVVEADYGWKGQLNVVSYPYDAPQDLWEHIACVRISPAFTALDWTEIFQHYFDDIDSRRETPTNVITTPQTTCIKLDCYDSMMSHAELVDYLVDTISNLLNDLGGIDNLGEDCPV